MTGESEEQRAAEEREESQKKSSEGERGGEASSRRMPFFATGEIVGDYGLLYAYWRHAGPRGEESILREEDFQHLRSLLREEGGARLDALLEKLRVHFRGRVDAGAAAKAVEEYYRAKLPPEEARDRVAELLAGWLIEAGSRWGLLRIRRSWEKEEDGNQ